MAKVCRSSVSTKFLICFFHVLLVWTANTWDPEIPLRSRKNARRYSFSECSLSRYKTWQCTSIPKSTTTATASATRCYYSSSCCYHPITFSNNFWVPCPMTCQKKVWSKVHQRQPLLLASPLIIDHHEGLMSHNSTNSLKPISRISFLSTLKFGAKKIQTNISHGSWTCWAFSWEGSIAHVQKTCDQNKQVDAQFWTLAHITFLYQQDLESKCVL